MVREERLLLFHQKSNEEDVEVFRHKINERDWKPRSLYVGSVDRHNPYIEIRVAYCWRESESTTFKSSVKPETRQIWVGLFENCPRYFKENNNKHISTFRWKWLGRQQRQKDSKIFIATQSLLLWTVHTFL